MMAIGSVINIRSQGKASLKRINALLDYPVEIKDEDVIDVEIKVPYPCNYIKLTIISE